MSSTPINGYVFTVDPNDTTDILYVPPSTIGAEKFIELTDVPPDYGISGQFIQSNGAGLQWVNGTGSLTNFIQLSDTPNNYGTASQSLITDGVSNITYGPIIPEFVDQLANVASILGTDDHKMVVIDNTATGYIYKSLDLIVKDEVSFSTLKDVPSNYSIADAGKCLIVNPTANGLVYSNLPAPSSFLGLSDTPSSYIGSSNYKVKVKSDETGLEFVVDSGGSGVQYFTDLLDVQLSYEQNSYKSPQINYLQNKLVSSPNGNTELTNTNFTSTVASSITKLWYSKILIHRPKLFFNYCYNANTISPNNNRGYTNELVVSIPNGSYAPHIIVGKNNARCTGNSPYTSRTLSPNTGFVWSFNENSGILTFTNPNVSNASETHPLFPVNQLITLKVNLSIGIQQSQTPNKDTMAILGLAINNTPSLLQNTCSCVMNGSSNNSKPSAGMQGTASKEFYINFSPTQALSTNFNVDLSFTSLNDNQVLIGGADIVYLSWGLEEM